MRKNDPDSYVRKIFANSFKGWSHVCVAGSQCELFNTVMHFKSGLLGSSAVHADRDVNIRFFLFKLRSEVINGDD
ncbi:hypothetical protein VC34_14820 [Pseudomonas fluorescens]|uniref:Uncharacterized protein n=1 Tax=Pseudomonas fluorescens TaxID=294 RepID=A0A0F4TFK2_PSEFL|nr:hypothetical protein VC34_14820 [Pseudomonas fluorescens]